MLDIRKSVDKYTVRIFFSYLTDFSCFRTVAGHSQNSKKNDHFKRDGFSYFFTDFSYFIS